MTYLKDDRAVETARSYRQLLLDSRRRQLEATATNVRRLARVFDAAVDDLAHRLERLPEGSIREAITAQLLADITNRLNALREDFAGLLTVGMLEVAQEAAEREALTAALVNATEDERLPALFTRTVTLSDGAEVSTAFGRVAEYAVNRTAIRVWSDGWELSDRLYHLDQATRQAVQDTLVQGVAEQWSAREMARRLETALAGANAENPRYLAMRLARSEINTSHREAHIQSLLTPQGTLKTYVQGIRWNLSLSHKVPDICDLWAAHDGEGLGMGVYSPGSVPSEHPHGLCVTTTVLVEMPDISLIGKKPQEDDVPESQVRYYANQGDPAAQRRLQELANNG